MEKTTDATRRETRAPEKRRALFHIFPSESTFVYRRDTGVREGMITREGRGDGAFVQLLGLFTVRRRTNSTNTHNARAGGVETRTQIFFRYIIINYATRVAARITFTRREDFIRRLITFLLFFPVCVGHARWFEHDFSRVRTIIIILIFFLFFIQNLARSRKSPMPVYA